jgi:HEAT repeat protein
MLGMRALVGMGSDAVGPLVQAMRDGTPGIRVFAAQTLSFLGPGVERSALVHALGDEETAVRLYAVDALGMSGAKDLGDLLGTMRETEDDRDVKKHIDYAMLREGTPVADEVIASMLAWDVETIGSAMVGEMAPGFVLDALTGEPIRLSSFRGKKAVVLIFIYGDT